MDDSHLINLLAFAQARAVIGCGERLVPCSPAETPAALIDRLFPDARPKLSGCRVAIDAAYASWDEPIGTGRELALIPPVSGG